MLLFLSDLHLADASSPAVPLKRLLTVVNDIVDRAAEVSHDTQVILLGDIFEILKSDVWLESNSRPWDTDWTPLHDTIVDRIVDRILTTNAAFFDGLAALRARMPSVRLHYIPGNHDGVLSDPDKAVNARKRIREVLHLDGGAQPFSDRFDCGLTRVVARHGHEWDPANRYDRGYVAVGDIVVIELLVRFPWLIRETLGCEANDPRVDFLREIDNVRPQAPFAIAQWILGGLKRCADNFPGTHRKIDLVLRDSTARFADLLDRLPLSDTAVGGPWAKMATHLASKFASQRVLSRIPRWHSVAEPAGPTRYLLGGLSGSHRFVVSGHTHTPEVRVLAASRSTPVTYLNTGTWKRVHAMSLGRGGTPSFTSWDEECAVVVRTPREQLDRLPAWEFHRVSRGH